jgi:hypothetical protein
MSNLQKFNDTLEDFNSEVDKLKVVSGAYEKLQGLIVAYSEINKQFADNSIILEKINELQKQKQKEIEKTLSEIENSNLKNKGELSDLVVEKTDLIRKDNKEFYKELESTIKIKLDDNKSQIKQLIESERTQIKQIFEIEFAKNTKELRQVIENEANKQTLLLLKNQNVIKVSVWIIGLLTITLALIPLFKN